MILHKSVNGKEKLIVSEALKVLCEMFSASLFYQLEVVTETSITFIATHDGSTCEMSGTAQEMRRPMLLTEVCRYFLHPTQIRETKSKPAISVDDNRKIEEIMELVILTGIDHAYRFQLAAYALMGLTATEDLIHATHVHNMSEVFAAIERMKAENIPFRQALAHV